MSKTQIQITPASHELDPIGNPKDLEQLISKGVKALLNLSSGHINAQDEIMKALRQSGIHNSHPLQTDAIIPAVRIIQDDPSEYEPDTLVNRALRCIQAAHQSPNTQLLDIQEPNSVITHAILGITYHVGLKLEDQTRDAIIKTSKDNRSRIAKAVTSIGKGLFYLSGANPINNKKQIKS